MDFNTATGLLELKGSFTKKDLYKSYRKKCLQYHPDKNKHGEEVFKLVNEAKDYLERYLNKKSSSTDDENTHDDGEKTYESYLFEYLNTLTTKYGIKNESLMDSLYKIVKECQTMSLRVFSELDYDKMVDIYEYVMKYNVLFHLDDSILQDMKKLIEKKTNETNIVVLHPTIDDLIQDNIFCLEHNDDTFYIPLWHHELYFKDNTVVRIVPELDKNTTIDTNNNVHVNKYYDLCELFDMSSIEFKLGTQSFNIPVSDLSIKHNQTVCIRGKGISRINTDEDDIFDNSKRGDVFVHITIYNNEN